MLLRGVRALITLIALAMVLGGLASMQQLRPALAQTGACGQNPSPPNANDPAIRVTSPADNARVSSPISVSGQARVFEANVSFVLLDGSGAMIGSGFATASQGAPATAPFTGTLAFGVQSETQACLRVFEPSAMDGGPRNIVQVPLTLLPVGGGSPTPTPTPGGSPTTGQWLNAPPTSPSAASSCPAANQWLLLYWGGTASPISQAAGACASADRIWASREGRWLGYAAASPNASDTWNLNTGEAHFMHGSQQQQPSPGGLSVSGTVTYRERIALTNDAVVTVKLVEEGGAVIAEQVIRTEGKQVPIAFSISYDTNRIQAAKRYSVEATITDRAQTIFRSGDPINVITMGAPANIEVVVRTAS